MKIRAVLFCRVSSREQEIDGYSLPAQEKLLKDYAFKLSLDPNEIKLFSISESAGGHKQRQVFEKMLAFVENNDVKIIICEKVDRLTRNLKDAVDVNDWLNIDSERQVHFVKENVILNRDSRSNEKFIWNIKVSVAQYYIDNLSEEVKKGQKEKLAQGWLPTTPPPGYKTIGDKGHKIHIIDDQKAPLVKKMFEYYDNGNYSLRSLTKKMREEGLRNRHGNTIVMSSMHLLLQNPFYIGKNRWNGVITQGEHEPLIDKEVFERVQRRLRGRGGPSYSKHFFLFNKIMKCKECDGSITWEIHKGIIYGHCHHYKPCKQTRWVKEKDIDWELATIFEGLEIKSKRIQTWILKALKESHQDEISYHASVIDEARTLYDRAKKRLDRLYDDKIDGKITEDFYSSKVKEYEIERDSALENMNKHANADSNYLEKGVNFYELSQHAKEKYLQVINIEDKRIQINQVFKSLTIDNGKLYFEYTPQMKLLRQLADLANKEEVVAKVEPVLKNFEQQGIVDLATQTRILQPICPDLLRS